MVHNFFGCAQKVSKPPRSQYGKEKHMIHPQGYPQNLWISPR